MFFIVGFTVNLIELFILSYTIKKLNNSINNNYILYNISVVIIAVLFAVIKSISNNFGLGSTVLIGSLLLLNMLFYKSKLVVFLCTSIWLIITVLLEMIFIKILASIQGKSVADVYTTQSISLVGASMLALVSQYSIVYFFISGIKLKSIEGKLSLYQYLLFLFSTLVLFNLYYLFDSIQISKDISENFFMFFFVCLVIFFIMLLGMFRKMVFIINENEEARLLKLNIDSHKVFIEEINILVDYFEHLRHDYRFHLQNLYALVKNHENIENLTYVKELLSESETNNLGFIKNNIVLSLMFMQKAKKAKNKNIIFDCNVPTTLNVKIKETDLNVIISNLLENAFEATSKLDHNREIKFDMLTNKNILFIEIENTFNGEIKVKDGIYTSFKRNIYNHGYGLKSVKRIVTSYDGNFEIYKTDDKFKVIISIPL